MIDDTDAWPLALALVTALRNENTRAQAEPLERLGVVPGTDAAFPADCGPGGWVRITQVFPSATFPTPAANPAASCASSLAVGVEVGILRCSPMIQTSGAEFYVPPAEEFQASARIALADMQIIRRAILNTKASDRLLVGWTPVGPDRMVGGFWTAFLGR